MTNSYESKETSHLLPKHVEDRTCKKDSRAFLVALRIPTSELCERLTYHSIASNLVMFCTNVLKIQSIDAVTISLVFSGTCYIVPPFAGWIADSYTGQYNAILACILIHMLGTFFLPAAAFVYSDWGPYDMPLDSRRVLFLLGLFLVALATGGLKANFSPFGASQVNHIGTHAVQTFFSWYYWGMTIGCLIAYTLGVYIQQEINFAIGYLLPALATMVAAMFFCSAKNKFVVTEPKGSQVKAIFQTIYEGLRNKWKQVPLNLPSFLDYAKLEYGGSRTEREVEDVKMLGAIFPIFFTGIIYWSIFAQLNSSYLLQAERLDLHLGDFIIPAASLHIFSYLIVFILVPLLDRVIYPLLDTYWHRPSPLFRMGLGSALACASVIAAGILELNRKDDMKINGAIAQEVGGEIFYASHLSVLYQMPQFILFGTSMVFLEATSLELAFSESPTSLKAVVTGMYMVTIGLGQYVGSLLVIIVNAATVEDEWFPNEINEGHLDYFFYLLAGLTAVGLIVFLIVSNRYQYAADRYIQLVEEPEDMDNNDIKILLLSSGEESDTSQEMMQGDKTFSSTGL